jgi:dihydropteroate synthase
MGIVNVTPDSFSDGGKYFDPAAAVEHGLRLATEGADLLDIGGESTRPGSVAIGQEEELRRVLPVIRAIREQTSVPLSIDTFKAGVARGALEAGVEVINDITAFTGDPQMLDLAVASGCGVCAMHMQGMPQTMQENPVYVDVVEDVYDYLRRRRDALLSAGIAQAKISLDPGIGFGKTTEHNLALLGRIERFHSLGCPVLVGLSRKGFIGRLLDDPKADRDAATIGAALAMALRGVQILRVHNVAAVRQALTLFREIVDRQQA